MSKNNLPNKYILTYNITHILFFGIVLVNLYCFEFPNKTLYLSALVLLYILELWLRNKVNTTLRAYPEENDPQVTISFPRWYNRVFIYVVDIVVVLYILFPAKLPKPILAVVVAAYLLCTAVLFWKQREKIAGEI